MKIPARAFSYRLLLLWMLLLILSVGCYLVILRKDSFRRDARGEQLEIKVVVKQSNDSAHMFDITGSTNLPSHVSLYYPTFSSQLPIAEALDSNKFNFNNVPVRLGKSQFLVRAYLLDGWKRVESGVKPITVLSGLVVDAEGRPVGQAFVTAISTKQNPGQKMSPEVSTDSSGYFTLVEPDPDPSKYVIRVEKEGYTPVEVKDYLVNNVPEASKISITRAPNTAAPLSADAGNVKFEILRKVTAAFSYRQLILKLEVTLPNDDKRIETLLKRDTSFSPELRVPLFVNSVFNNFTVGEKPVGIWFKGVPYQVTRSDTGTTFRIESIPQKDAIFSYRLVQNHNVKPDWLAIKHEKNTFNIETRDYQLESLAPLPASLDKGVATWVSEGQGAPPHEIQVRLAYDHLANADSFFRMLRSSPYGLLPFGSYSAILFLYGFLKAIPLLWLLYLLQKYPPQAGHPGERVARRLQTVVPWLTALLFVEPMFYLMSQQSSRVISDYFVARQNNPQGGWLYRLTAFLSKSPLEGPAVALNASDLRVVAAWLLLLAVCVGLLTLCLSAFRRGAVAVWLNALLRAIFSATLICLLLTLALAVALRNLPYDLVGLTQLLPSALGVLVLTGVFLSALYLALPSRWAFGWRPVVAGLGLFAFLLLLAFPASPASLYATPFDANPSLITLMHLRRLFRVLEYIVPYVPLLGLALLLRQTDSFRRACIEAAVPERIRKNLSGTGGGAVEAVGLPTRSDEPLPTICDSVIATARIKEYRQKINLIDMAAATGSSGSSFHLLKNEGDLTRPFISGAALLIFAAYVVGTSATVIIIPLSFLFALWMAREFVFKSQEQAAYVERVMPCVFERRTQWMRQSLAAQETEPFRVALKQIEKRLEEGELSPAEFEKSRAELKVRIQQYEMDEKPLGGVEMGDMVLAVGAQRGRWANAFLALKQSAGLMIPLVFLDLWDSSIPWTDSNESYLLLRVCAELISSTARWMTAAFFFGYFFPDLRGNNGLKKSFYVSLSAVICFSVSVHDLNSVILRTAEYIFFFTALGLWVFDYQTVRSALGSDFTWKRFLRFVNIPTISAFTALVLTVVTALGTSMITKGLTLFLMYVIGMISPELRTALSS